MKRIWVVALLIAGVLAASVWSFTANPESATGPASVSAVAEKGSEITLLELLVSNKYASYEKVAMVTNVFISLAGLAYALLLVKQVREADQGTARMQEIAHAVREGANAYLYQQFRVVGLLIVVITVVLFFAAKASGAAPAIAWGRAIVFLVGSTFSATVGFVGMRLATTGNLRVAAAGVKLNPAKLSCKIGGITVFKNGAPRKFDEKKASSIISQAKHTITVDLGVGRAGDFCYGCDLSAEYVRINAEYRT